MNFEHLCDTLYQLILEARRDEACELLDETAKEHGYEFTASHVLEPTLVRVGEQWMKDHISLAQGYVAGKVAEDLFEKLSRRREEAGGVVSKGTVVLGNTEDDYHALGRKMVGVFLKSAGWSIVDLGNDVLAEEFVDAAEEHGASVIGVSAMMFSTAENIRKVRAELDKRQLSGKIHLAVGGAVFRLRPELVQEVGGDLTADNAIKAPEVFDTFWREHISGKEGRP